MLGETPHRFRNRIIRPHGDDVADHHIQRFHVRLPPPGLLPNASSKGSLDYKRVTAEA